MSGPTESQSLAANHDEDRFITRLVILVLLASAAFAVGFGV